jgi:hypothetical protein
VKDLSQWVFWTPYEVMYLRTLLLETMEKEKLFAKTPLFA